MGDEIAVSIIMPVYNCAEVIDKAIKSILGQSLSEIEIIVVDDCSTDNTVEKIKEIQKSDKRVKLIQQKENKGPGAAKNEALKNAIGEYVAFCDADDWIEKDMLKNLLQIAQKNKFDVMVSGISKDCYNSSGELNKKVSIYMETMNARNETELAQMVAEMDREKLYAYACNKIYKLNVIKKNQVVFSDKLFGEDYDFNMSFFLNASSAGIIPECYYHYVKMNKESLTERIIPDYYEIIMDRFERMRAYMNEKGVYAEETKEKVLTTHIKHLMVAIARNCNPKIGFTFLEKYKFVKRIFKNQYSVEAIRFAKAYNKKEKIINGVFKTQSVFLNLLFGNIISKIL